MQSDFFGTLPGWITAFSTTAGFAAVLIALMRSGVSLIGLKNKKSADILDHYVEELERVIERQHACEERETKLRERVTALEEDNRGLHRQLSQLGRDKLLILEGKPSKIAPHSTAAAQRSKENDK